MTLLVFSHLRNPDQMPACTRVCVVKLERGWRETEDEILRDQETESSGTRGHTKLFSIFGNN